MIWYISSCFAGELHALGFEAAELAEVLPGLEGFGKGLSCSVHPAVGSVL